MAMDKMEKSERNTKQSVLRNSPHKKHKFKNLARNYKIMYDNVDVTPKPMPKIDKLRPSSAEQISFLGFNVSESPTSMSLASGGAQFTADILGLQSTGSVIKPLDDISDELEHIISDHDDVVTLQEGHGISDEFEIMPTTLSVLLVETPVFYLLELPSITAEVGTEEGEKVEQDNTYYDYLTIGKGRNRKTVNAEVQTATTLLKSRYTVPEKLHHSHNYAFASNWDMYDSYENSMVCLAGAQNPMATKTKSNITQDTISTTDPIKSERELERQMVELLKNERFQTCLTVMERVLANNNFHVQQKRFRGLIEQDPFRPDIEFKYRLELLWTFRNARTEGQPVTCLQWNPKNSDVLAVGYGKFFYAENKSGFVFCWNIKNPSQPEREHYFGESVTSLAFSNYEPNLLAVGLYDGTVNVLDISCKQVRVLFTSTRYESPCHEPIWSIAWFPPDDYNAEDEQLICVSQDGRVVHFKNTKNKELSFIPMMRVTRLQGKAKGIYYNKPCPAHEIPVSRYPGALVLTNHPVHRNIYYVGSEEGSIHKCSRNYLHQHMEVFMAHNGPVYHLQFSPFCRKLFLSCGADWVVNIWTENIKEPLISLLKSMETIDGAVWCPSNSTVIANIAGSDIYLWDIQRKTYLPASVHRSPAGSRNTVLQFTRSGRNLVVGDIEGNVHIFSLEDMPFPPFYQEDMLEQVVQKNLVTRPHLAHELQKVRGLAANKSEDQ